MTVTLTPPGGFVDQEIGEIGLSTICGVSGWIPAPSLLSVLGQDTGPASSCGSVIKASAK